MENSKNKTKSTESYTTNKALLQGLRQCNNNDKF